MKRDPRGIPTGGRFAPDARAESDVPLGHATIVDTVSAGVASGKSNLERRLAMRGAAHESARTGAATASVPYPAVLDELAGTGRDVTVSYRSDTGSISAIEGRVSVYGQSLEGRDGSFLMALHGDNFHVVDAEEGTGQHEVLAERYHALQETVPELAPADFSGLPEAADGRVNGAYVLTYPTPRNTETHGVVFLASHRDGEDVIGQIIFPQGSISSGETTLSTRALSRRGGSVTGYRAGSLHTDDVASRIAGGVTTEQVFALLKEEA